MACCNNATEGIASIETLNPEVVFLDIEMPVMNGFVMLQQLNYKNFELIFVTAYDHYAIKAIRFSALDYLVKPVEIDDLKAAVQKAESNKNNRTSHLQLELLLGQLNKKQLKRISIPTTDGLQFMNVDDILYLEASNNYTNLYVAGNIRHLVCRTLKDFEELLPGDTFLRIHHATIINKDRVEKYIRGEGGQVLMQNGKLLDVSKRKKLEFLQAIKQ
jgi:two-component system, LytTR family, response regulator